MNFFLNLEDYRSDLTAPFSSGKRRDYRYSPKNGFIFSKLDSKQKIAEYYEVLKRNLKKLGLQVVHTLDELYDLKFNRFQENIEFYGVYREEKIVAGSMLFYSREQRAKWARLHAHLATAARVNTPLLCSAASMMPRCLQRGC